MSATLAPPFGGPLLDSVHPTGPAAANYCRLGTPGSLVSARRLIRGNPHFMLMNLRYEDIGGRGVSPCPAATTLPWARTGGTRT